jgi:hypothetical protein
LGYKTAFHCKPLLCQQAGFYRRVIDFPYCGQNPLQALMRSPLRMRLFLMRESNLTIKKDNFTVSRIKYKKRNVLLKELEDSAGGSLWILMG